MLQVALANSHPSDGTNDGALATYFTALHTKNVNILYLLFYYRQISKSCSKLHSELRERFDRVGKKKPSCKRLEQFNVLSSILLLHRINFKNSSQFETIVQLSVSNTLFQQRKIERECFAF